VANINWLCLNLTRRTFIGLVGHAAFLVGLGGLIRVGAREETAVRPPGAISEPEFLATCVKCQRCAEICPTQVITQTTLAENLLGFGTPRLTFRQGYCTLCLKCAAVCPTSALILDPAEPVVPGVAQINPPNCVAWNWGGCTKCYQVCPQKAVQLDNAERPVVDATRCTGCGQCEFECPSAALRSGAGAGGKGIAVIPLPVRRTGLAISKV
jgi:ferredoxin-type protein NapG